MPKRDPTVALRQMRDLAAEAVAAMRGRSRADLTADRMWMHAMMRIVEVIGEAATRVPDAVRGRHPKIPWADIVGMRNKLIHGYDEVDLDRLFLTLQDDVPGLLRELEKIPELR